MTNTQANTDTIRKFYDVLEAEDKDMVALAGFLDEDIDFHVIRPKPMRTYPSRDAMFAYLAKVQDVVPEDGDIKLEQIGADQDYVMCIHREAAGTERDHRHVMIYRMGDGKIVEAWEMTLGNDMDEV
ncbi:MAG: nuclear transport factor 2 family protein [Pseudomonadota bacterium]